MNNEVNNMTENKQKTLEDLAIEAAYDRAVADDTLHKYCPYHGKDFGPSGITCEGRYCDEAFVLWMDDAAKCDFCGQYFLLEDLQTITSMSDGDKKFCCLSCEESGD